MKRNAQVAVGGPPGVVGSWALMTGFDSSDCDPGPIRPALNTEGDRPGWRIRIWLATAKSIELILLVSNGDNTMALSSPSRRAKQRSRAGSLRGLLDALVTSRLQQTEHEIARYLESTGGKLTDTVAREIEERLYPHRNGRLF